MKKRKAILNYALLAMGVFLVFASSCQKDDDVKINSFTDPRDSTVYKTVTIGNQVWMAENLRYLPSVVGPETGSQTTPFYYVYGYNGTVVADAKATSNYIKYGVLYNWSAAMNELAGSTDNPSGIQGVCPAGWHLPSDAEWTQLIDFLGGEIVAERKLKETGKTHWINANTNATNETGFTALPGGVRNSNGAFSLINLSSYWWSTTEYGTYNAWNRSISFGGFVGRSYSYDKEFGFSIRCIKN